MDQAILRIAAFVLAVPAGTWAQPQPRTIFKERINLTDNEIQHIEHGQVVTKVLNSAGNYGVLVFGAVYINSPIEKFVRSFRNIQKLKENKVYLDLQEFSVGGAPPKLSDFDRLTLEKKDIDELETCKPGDCDIQVFDDLEAFQKRIDWKSDRYAQANRAVRQRVLEGMTTYLAGGLKAFGNYRDRQKALNLYEATRQMVDSSFYLPQDRAPEIYRHVVDYPKGKLPGAEDFFYWEKIDFGQEPTLRVNHVSIFPKGFGAAKVVIANKQLYASRYIRVALQMFYCISDTEHPEKPGFFLVEMNDSRLPDFGGLKLAVVRKVATGKSVDATRDTLSMYAARLNAH